VLFPNIFISNNINPFFALVAAIFNIFGLDDTQDLEFVAVFPPKSKKQH